MDCPRKGGLSQSALCRFPRRRRSALRYKPPVEFETELRPVAPTLNQDEALSLN